MTDGMKFRRRKAERPQEIVQAAAEVFAEKGFAASKLDEIAKRAGVTKGTLYLYYATKESLFEAVVQTYAASTVSLMRELIVSADGNLLDGLSHLFEVALENIGHSRIPPVAKMVIAEAGNFPELARVWHREVIAPMLTAFAERIRQEQKIGRIAAGPPELYALSMLSPFVMSMLFREVFGHAAMPMELLRKLPAAHARVMAEGMSLPIPKAATKSRNGSRKKD